MRRTPMFMFLFAVAACTSSPEAESPTPDTEPASTATATTPPAATADATATPTEDPKAAAEAKKKEEEKKKLEEDFAKLAKETAAEKARFDDKVKKDLVDLSNKKFPTFKAALEASMKGSHRAPGAKDRDAERHPVEMLTFFGLQQSSHVLELDAGAGWYTELLAPILRTKGKLAVTGADPNGPATERSTFYGQRLRAVLDKAPELGDKIDYVVTDGAKGFAFDPSLAGKFDIVLAFRALHGWQRRNQLDQNLAQVFTVLKPGGVLAVEAHRAKEGADPKASAEKGYLPQAYVIERAKAAGFELGATSEMNANPKDTTDHPDGVWSLPPTLRGGEKDKAKYLAIGESDRMTIKLVKPKK